MHAKHHALTTLLLTTTVTAIAQHAGFPDIPYTHHDWEIACDNTRTCRAAGYQADDAERNASILLTRAAGPSTAVQAQLQLEVTDEPVPKRVRMRIDGLDLGDIALKEAKGTLSPSQTRALLNVLPTAKQLAWAAGARRWTISVKGANAVLLKMDEFQGRLGTPDALIRKGNRPASSVLPALPLPEITAARVGNDRAEPGLIPVKQRAILFAEIRKTISKDEMAVNSCDNFDASVANPEKWTAYRLSENRLLVSAECWMAAYNTGDGYWVVNDHPPYAPALVTNVGTGYGQGTITSSQRGRGIGDCMGSDSWTWDGRRFVHTASMTTGMCKHVAPGGAWELPTLVVKVSQQK
jgi:hypothetical protein